MTTLTNQLFFPVATAPLTTATDGGLYDGHYLTGLQPYSSDPEFLRSCAWEIGERRAADAFSPALNHVGLGMVTPYGGFAHWRILQSWVDQTAWSKGTGWHNCRLVLRLYDVSYIHFNGFNAHQMQDVTLPGLCGQLFFKLPRAGTHQLGEVGFLLQSGEFVPAARSQVVPFPPDAPLSHRSHAALLVTERGRVEDIGNIWDQQRILNERRQPRLRHPLRIATFTFASLHTGQEGASARFVAELAAEQAAQGHDVHVFLPASDSCSAPLQVAGVQYHPLNLSLDGTPIQLAQTFGQAAKERLHACAPFDLIHLHEWMTALIPRNGQPAILSLSSLETTRRNGSAPSSLSLDIQKAEQEVARAVDCILTPDWLQGKAVADLGVPPERVRAFPLEGRVPNEWERPLDCGQVKKEIGLGPFDRLLLFVGPLEHAAGVDLLLEALPVLLQRASNVRVVFAGAGYLHGHLDHRSHQLGVAHAVRLLGHIDSFRLTGLLRAAEALVLPSRYRVPFDDAVVDLARRAGRPVITTHGGPAHLVRHEETGIITYDNPGSMVWAADRILCDPTHAERMGHNGRRTDAAIMWSDVARYYLELCAACFAELTQIQW
jgi:glycogen(starch) synthase